jgi:hypothetical protein
MNIIFEVKYLVQKEYKVPINIDQGLKYFKMRHLEYNKSLQTTLWQQIN